MTENGPQCTSSTEDPVYVQSPGGAPTRRPLSPNEVSLLALAFKLDFLSNRSEGGIGRVAEFLSYLECMLHRNPHEIEAWQLPTEAQLAEAFQFLRAAVAEYAAHAWYFHLPEPLHSAIECARARIKSLPTNALLMEKVAAFEAIRATPRGETPYHKDLPIFAQIIAAGQEVVDLLVTLP